MSDVFRRLNDRDRCSSVSSQDDFSVPSLASIHLSQLSNDFGSLYNTGCNSDVTFLLDDNQRIPAHRIILAARSPYFRALLFNGMRESEENEVHIVDTNVDSFRQILKYAYTGEASIESLSDEGIIDMLSLAHRYEFGLLEKFIDESLRMRLNIDNLSLIFNASQLYSMAELKKHCLEFSDTNAKLVLDSGIFTSLSPDSIIQLIQRDSFCADEIDIFHSVKQWIDAHPDLVSEVQSLINCIRLPLIPQALLLSVVRPSGLIDPNKLLDSIAIQSDRHSKQTVFRGIKEKDQNVAVGFRGAVVISGNNPSTLFDYTHDLLSRPNSDHSDFWTNHLIGDPEGITVELGNSYIINTINLRLESKERSFSYVVDVSMDRQDWIRIADYRKYFCRSRQRIFFAPRAVKFIRVLCTSAPLGAKYFYLGALEALFCTSQCDSFDPATTLIVPSENVATIAKEALVVEGVSRCRNALINGETQFYNWDVGYTCHQIQSGAIIVQLAQPFLLSTMRLLLWDCDDRFYSYYVEVSVDQKSWKMVADRTRLKCRGWQYISFEQTPVVFVRLIGTRNSSNEVFHVVHFETPACPNAPPLHELSAIPYDVDDI